MSSCEDILSLTDHETEAVLEGRGVYVLILEVSRETEIEVGRAKRSICFKRGFYAYVGSALSGFEHRIQRHLRSSHGETKKKHWHIDFLLASPAVRIVAIILAQTKERKECEIASHLLRNGLEFVRGFGCSDCGCESHLFFSPQRSALLSAVRSSFIASGLSPSVVRAAVSSG